MAAYRVLVVIKLLREVTRLVITGSILPPHANYQRTSKRRKKSQMVEYRYEKIQRKCIYTYMRKSSSSTLPLIILDNIFCRFTTYI